MKEIIDIKTNTIYKSYLEIYDNDLIIHVYDIIRPTHKDLSSCIINYLTNNMKDDQKAIELYKKNDGKDLLEIVKNNMKIDNNDISISLLVVYSKLINTLTFDEVKYYISEWKNVSFKDKKNR